MRAEHSTNEWELHPILRVIWNSHIQSAVIRYLAKSLFLIPNMTDSSARKEARRIICMAMATPTLFKVKTVYKMVILRSSASTKQELVCGWTFVSIHFKAPHHGNIIINVCVCIFFSFAYPIVYAIQHTRWHQDKSSEVPIWVPPSPSPKSRFSGCQSQKGLRVGCMWLIEEIQKIHSISATH